MFDGYIKNVSILNLNEVVVEMLYLDTCSHFRIRVGKLRHVLRATNVITQHISMADTQFHLFGNGKALYKSFVCYKILLSPQWLWLTNLT